MSLQRRLSRLLPAAGGATGLKLSFMGENWRRVTFVRERNGLQLIVGQRGAIEDDRCNYYYRIFLPSLVHPMSRVTLEGQLDAEISDGSADASGCMLFSGSSSNALLMPDPDFFNSAGYARQRHSTRSQRPWSERVSNIVWRGATTGDAGYAGATDDTPPLAIQRVAFCQELSGLPGIDAKIYKVVEPLDPTADTDMLQREKLIGGHVPEHTWLDSQFAFDIDGNTNAWSNLFVRLLFGCCVIKVASPGGYRQWYYDRLIPWIHYVPVSADLSDLRMRIDWCWSHLDECRDIGMAGKSLADKMTFDAEMRDAAQRIEGRLSRAL